MQMNDQADEEMIAGADIGFEAIEGGRGVVMAAETDARGRMSAAAIADRFADGVVVALSAAGFGRHAMAEQGLSLKVLASAVEVERAPAIGEAWRVGLTPVPVEEGIGFAAELSDPLMGDVFARGIVEVVPEDASGVHAAFPDDIADRLAEAAIESAGPADALQAGAGVVGNRHCDIMGHMNVQFYGAAFDQACRLLGVGLGLAEGVVLKPVRSVIRFKAEQRLGVSRAPTRLPAPAGAGILVWKDILQSQRSFRLTALFNWFTLFSVMLGMPFFPDAGSRALAVGVWVILIGRVCVVRLRGDLSRWSLVRQLPISSNRFILFEMSAAYLLIIGLSWAGLACGALLSGASMVGLAAILPGIAAGAAGMAAFDVIRRSRCNLLLNGSVPEVSAGGILLGLLFAAIPLFIYTLLPGIFGGFFAAFLSLWLGYLACNWVVHSYSRIDAA